MTKIYRSATDKKIAGICGGLGELFDVDSTIIRIAAVFVTIATGVCPAVITYLVGWVIIPERPASEPPTSSAKPAGT